MIVTRLKGGLGNQLFQYATTRNLAIKYSTDFYFDIEYFKKTKNGDLYLNKFSKTKLPLWEGKCGLARITDEFVYKNISDDVYLTGWWQSEKYFKDYEFAIKKELEFDEEIKKYIIEKYPFIEENSVSMHIRRGDYLLKQDQYPIPSIEYYKSAYDCLGNKDTKIFVLSDNINWCKENIKFDNIHYVEENNDIIDLCIMSMCRNNIICNSTYSWWGAWLNNHADKIVIAPKIWFGPALNLNDLDIVPNTWKKI
jgi:hypothetical protein